ncbi:unnamed protein product [Prunus armeniaca]
MTLLRPSPLYGVFLWDSEKERLGRRSAFQLSGSTTKVKASCSTSLPPSLGQRLMGVFLFQLLDEWAWAAVRGRQTKFPKCLSSRTKLPKEFLKSSMKL